MPRGFTGGERNGFAPTKGRVFGHCEENCALQNKTVFRCKQCGCFVCTDHHGQHRQHCVLEEFNQ